jgi:hypothetical protein
MQYVLSRGKIAQNNPNKASLYLRDSEQEEVFSTLLSHKLISLIRTVAALIHLLPPIAYYFQQPRFATIDLY